MAFLIKSTNTYKVPTVEDALRLRQELEGMPGELTSFKYTTKFVKSKGEIIDEYQLVTATIQFNAEKSEDEDMSSIREKYE